jgi:hypothetical protein
MESLLPSADDVTVGHLHIGQPTSWDAFGEPDGAFDAEMRRQRFGRSDGFAHAPERRAD